MQKIVYKLIDLIDAGKLTDEHEKVFIRSAATLNSVSKDALHRHFNELYDRLRVYEDMYFDLHDKIEEISDAYDKDGESSVSVISTGVPVGSPFKAAATVVMPRWISTGERLPPAYIRVYAAIKGADDAIIAWVDDKGRWDDDDSWTYEKIVTHWMPLPELPEVRLCEND